MAPAQSQSRRPFLVGSLHVTEDTESQIGIGVEADAGASGSLGVSHSFSGR